MIKSKLQNAAYLSVLIAAVTAAVCLFIKYILPSLLPIVLAYLISELIKPLSAFMQKYAKIAPKVTSITAVLVAASLLWQLGGAAFRELISELEAFAASAAEDIAGENGALRTLMPKAEALLARMPTFLKLPSASTGELINRFIESAALKAAEYSSSLAQAMIVSVPRIMLAMFTFAISLYYFCCDPQLLGKLCSALPSKLKAALAQSKSSTIAVAKSYCRSYILILLINIALLSIGFSLLGISPALMLAVIISAADLLPVIGVGTILLPWSAAALLLGNSLLGISLLALYFTIAFIRQLIEPRLVGNTTGLDPLISLTLSYVSLRLFGILGMLCAPLLASFLLAALKNTKYHADSSKK